MKNALPRLILFMSTVIPGLISGVVAAQENPYQGWQHSGVMTILTTPEGANLPAAVSLNDFPLLVRLNQDGFDFKQAEASGADIRFTNSAGQKLAYQLEAWDAKKGSATIWVRIPNIKGNERQPIKMFWGKPDATSESNGSAVFNESNGYVSVWHMQDVNPDEVGTIKIEDKGTTSTTGMVGQARHFPGGKGITGGEKITGLPSASNPHSTEVWFRAEQPNSVVVAWGNEKGQGKVVMQYASPPHVRLDCYFSNGNVDGNIKIPGGEWVQVVHSYESGNACLYVNGVLDVVNTAKGSPLNIQNPARLYLGGWYNNYNFIGDMDEVRISKVSRPAEWVKLQYENQKTQQTVVGHVIQPGKEFSVSSATATVQEGKSVTLTAQVGGAQKLYWLAIKNGQETVLATDRFSFTYDAGRVTGDQTVQLQCKAVYDNGVKTKDVTITIKEAIPEPVFTLVAPPTWNGRSEIDIVPQITNAAALRSAGVDALVVTWQVGDIAIGKEVLPGKLLLKRAQNSGQIRVTATVSNGGQPSMQSVTMQVTEPSQDAWVVRQPAADEKPEDGQFFARNDKNIGTLYYNGTLAEAGESVFLKVYANDQAYKSENVKLAADKKYAFTVPLKPGMVIYKVEFGVKENGSDKVLHTVNNLICGDAYLLDGQSNTVATDWGKGDFPETNQWIRSFGSMGGNPKNGRWGNAIRRGKGDQFTIGYWGFDLAKRLLDNHKMPICIINGAVGGTRIDQHQRHMAEPTDLTTIYGRLLWRVQEAKLTHGIRGVLWHQGENDQGSDGPTGGYGWENYRSLFIDMASAWKQDYPNIQHYYIYQIWPKSCAMGHEGSDNRLREVQRQLPTAFAHMSIMSTLGIEPPGGCHYPPEGYAMIANLIAPLLERDFYGVKPASIITPANLSRVSYANNKHDEIVLEFDQPVQWNDVAVTQLYLDGESGKVAAGSVAGNVVTLKLSAPSMAKYITYIDGKNWSQKALIKGVNGIAALTFCEVPIAAVK